jgi:cyclase
MLEPRFIPCLLLHEGGLYKTVKFRQPNYIGDPINAVKIFNEKGADELVLLDIDATVRRRGPQFQWVQDIVSEAFMPVTYGGGVRSLDDMGRLFGLGVEKVSISAAALEFPELVADAARQFGSQSVIVTIDVKRSFWSKSPIVCTHNGRRTHKIDVLSWALQVESAGAGEIILNSVDRDGMMEGYDHALIKELAGKIRVPIVALGGAGALDDMEKVISSSGASAAAAGSLFVYRSKGQGVLINYPSRTFFKFE